jgi:hypothetical protein
MTRQIIKALASSLDCQRRIIRALETNDSELISEAKGKLHAADRALMQASATYAERHGRRP